MPSLHGGCHKFDSYNLYQLTLKENKLNSNELYRAFWYAAFTCLTISIASMSACTVSTQIKINETLSRMITEGVTAKEAGCAISIANGNDAQHTRLYCAIK